MHLSMFLNILLIVGCSLSAMDNQWHQVNEWGIDQYGSVPQRPAKPPLIEVIAAQEVQCRYCSDVYASDALDQHITQVHKIMPGEQIFNQSEYTLSARTHINGGATSSARKRRKLNRSNSKKDVFVGVNNQTNDDDDNDNYTH